MSDFDHAFREEFIRGLRSVSAYIGSICQDCSGSCGEKPDDQCLVSAWSSYIQAAFEHDHDAYETGRRCAVAQLQHREGHNQVRFTCDASAGQ